MREESPIRMTVAAAVRLALGFAVAGHASAAELPVPCATGSCGSTGPITWVTSGRATGTVTQNTFTINQETDKAILNWASFNIGPDGRVVFRQPDANSIALNRIFQGNPSRIFGALEANGEVYLVNQNGFLFGQGSRTQAGGLLVSTLDISDSVFENGILSPDLLTQRRAALESDGRASVLDREGNPVLGPDGEPLAVQLRIEAGATLASNRDGGRVLLASRTVDNAGRIEADNGQVILAAGEKVYLQASTDPALRGILVEVDAGGEAWNRVTGQIESAHGNVTVIGLAVNQQGRISATTSVAANGSIRLFARDTVQFQPQLGGGVTLLPQRAGTVELGAGSVTEVLPDVADEATAVDDQDQLRSTVEITGLQATLRGGSRITATGGDVDILARPNPSATSVYDPDSRVRIEAGAVIDVSGSDVLLPMSRNIVAVELRGTELRDAPNQRDGALRGQTVYVDARFGTPLADVSGALASVPRSVAERTATGGTVSIESDGDLVLAEGATIDVSGGRIDYASGPVQTSLLIATDGSIVDIGSADPNRTYVGVINPTARQVYDRWGVTELIPVPGIARSELGYVEGRDAGTVRVAAPGLLLDGSLLGHAINGPLQRDSLHRADGGRLVIGRPDGGGLAFPDFRAPSVTFSATTSGIVVDEDEPLPLPRELLLPVDFLLDGGFTRAEIYSNGDVTLPGGLPLELAAGSSLSLTANQVAIDAGVRTAGGALTFRAVPTAGIAGTTSSPAGVLINDGVALDVRGNWTNDSRTHIERPNAVLTSPTWFDGGSIVLESDRDQFAGGLSLGSGVSLLAGGGGWIDAEGRLTPGAGGLIRLASVGLDNTLTVGTDVTLDAHGLQGARGGTFELAATRIALAQGSGWSVAQDYRPGDDGSSFFTVGSSLFYRHGFSDFDLAATGEAANDGSDDALRVLAGSTIEVQTASRVLDLDYLTRDTGAAVEDFTTAQLLPDPERPTPSVLLRVEPNDDAFTGADGVGGLSVQAGATMIADAGASFELTSIGGIRIDGAIRTAAGSVRLFVDNPDSDFDGGFDPALRIELGEHAAIDVSGTAVLEPNDAGLRIGEVRDGGSVELIANRGSVVTAAGSFIDVSGTTSPIDQQIAPGGAGYERHVVASGGGELTVRAPESIVLDGQFHAHAGIGDSGIAHGGSLAVELTRVHGFNAGSDEVLIGTYPTPPRTLRLVDGSSGGVPPVESGFATVDTSFILGAGVDALRLEASNVVELESGLDLALGRSIELDAPAIAVIGGGEVSLQAAYLAIGQTLQADSSAVAIAGDGELRLQGRLIDVFGSTVLQGVDQATLSSSGDIRLRGTTRLGVVTGDLRLAGDLTFAAERVYPTTFTEFTLAATGPGSRITIAQNGTSPGTPLSAGGSVRIVADEIHQHGSLYAPFGRIELNAVDALELRDGSLTSVSGAGALLPFGRVVNGETWNYLAGNDVEQTAIPEREVALTGDSISIAADATVDLSGGGDLYAYEWLPGTGGSVDALAPGVTPGLYAIMPGLGSEFAPFDSQEYAGSDLRPGDSVYLSGGGGVESGFYALLPARYALLPGAFLVQAVDGFADLAPSAPAGLPDGTPVIAGYRSFAETGIGDTRYTGFSIRPGTEARNLATYVDHKASSYFPARAKRLDQPPPAVPADAGSLALNATLELDLLGTVETGAAQGGRGATISVSSSDLAIVGQAGAGGGAVEIEASLLTEWNPERLILGGSLADDGSIDVAADSVSVTAGAELVLDEIVLIARDEVAIDGGSLVASTSGESGAAIEGTLGQRDLVVNDAGAAIVAVSDVSRLVPVRGTGAATGRVDIASGSTLASRGSLVVDAPAGATLAGELDGDGAAWSLGAGRLVFADADAADSLTITTGLLDDMTAASAVRLASSGSIDFETSVSIGADQGPGDRLEELTLVGSGLRILADGITVDLAADTVRLEGLDQAPPPPAPGTAELQIASEFLDIGPGRFALSGFANSELAAAGQITGRGSANLQASGNLLLTAPRLTAASGADVAIVAQGNLRVTRPDGEAAPEFPAAELGGALSLSAQTLEFDGTIFMPTGSVELAAVGDLEIGENAVVDVSGEAVTVGGRSVDSWGGSVNISAGGDLDAAAGSMIDVSGSGRADAGAIAARAGGMAGLQSGLRGVSEVAGAGGSFALEAGSLADITGLLTQLAQGQFDSRQSFHVEAGDLVVSDGSTARARHLAFSSDGGEVRVEGDLIAESAAERSSIRLYGTGGVTIAGTATLAADARGGQGRAGSIELGTSAGTVELLAGATISAAGDEQMGGLLVRAPALAADVAIGDFSADLAGVGEVVIEPVLATQLSAAPTAAELDGARIAAQAWFDAAATAVDDRLSADSGADVIIRPGIELQRSGDVTLPELDMNTWRFGGQPAHVSVRATGTIRFDGSWSDGFVTTGDGPTSVTDLIAGESATLRFAAGADLASADPLRVARGAAGDIDLAADVLVRTGTGDLSLVAARDLRFLGAGASAYTAGRSGAPMIAGAPTGTSMSFAVDGGQLALVAGRDIVGSPVVDSNMTEWLRRQGTGSSVTIGVQPTAWGADIKQFNWNAGTLGGGDLSAHAGRNAFDFSAAAADSAVELQPDVLTYFGGGALAVTASDDIGSGLFYVAQGSGQITAGDAFTSVRSSAVLDPLGTAVALGDADLTLRARTGMLFESAFNPTVMRQAQIVGRPSTFFTYGERSALTLEAASGNVVVRGQDQRLQSYFGSASSPSPGTLSIFPGSLYVRAHSGDISLAGASVLLVPTDIGQVDLFASRDVTGGAQNGSLTLADAPEETVPTPLAPGNDVNAALGPTLNQRLQSARRQPDDQPVLISAGRDITTLTTVLSKSARLVAGRDIRTLRYVGQNLRADDVTLFDAARDLSLDRPGSAIEVGGPGRVDILAGREVDLGISAGVTTVGRLVNAEIPDERGADLTVIAGYGQTLDASSFVDDVVGPSSAYRELLVDYVEATTGATGLGYAEADALFSGFDEDTQRPFLVGVFFSELVASGREANTDAALGFDRGYAAIDALLPGSREPTAEEPSPYDGDLGLEFSRIYTLGGGDIAILVPGGLVNVGLAVPPQNLGLNRQPSDLGVVAQREGSVRMYAYGDVLVNQSRIFTLLGGDIAIWSTKGDIDAGRGAKTSISAPPPAVKVDSTGRVTLDFAGAVAGSGIRAIVTDEQVEPGDVDLIAPAGIVDAGDAGIGAAGNLNIAAQQVVGLDNIQVGGVSTGVPSETSGLGASLSGVSAVANSASSTQESMSGGAAADGAAEAPLADSALSWLEVFVVGLGECAPTDDECLRREREQK